MRRPRHKLQVSTFPFLAVLLGAMGSLIFLLLVMDRRAKIVARNKVREAQEARQAAASRADRQRQEEWERQRRLLHETLAAQDRQLTGQLQVARDALDQSALKIQAQAAAQLELHARIDAEQADVMRQRDDLRRRQTDLTQTTQLEESSKIELARLTRDLLDLEQTLDAMKRLKQQQRPTYSLVPYRGPRGAGRMPIYVECTRTGLVFLPDGARLTDNDLDLPRVRSEVERRHGPLIKAKRLDPFHPDPAAEQPYVLFLIRPDGIASFYRGQNALRGYQIDFGYEMVDADWKLEAPTEPQLALAASEPSGDRSAVARAPQPAQRQPNTANQSGAPSASGNAGPPVAAAAAATVGNPSSPGGAPVQLGVPATLAFRPSQAKGAPWSASDGPAPRSNVPGASPNGKVAAPAEASAKRQAESSRSTPQLTFQPEPSEPGNALGRLGMPAPAGAQQPRPSPVSLGRVLGNRDFVITIACYGEGALLTPGGASFAWNGAADPKQTDAALVRIVTQLVQRRQATVQAGEPPYRAVLRFEVHEQGRRTYYRVYPLLEKLRLPMVREDVEE